jgi:two-component system sensor histidine kinase DegS
MVFRSVQSLLAVSVQQLKAHSLRLVVDVGDSEVKATLEDDGQGFDPIVDLDPSQGDSDVQAINTVRERVELINGSIDIYSAEGEGSRFAIRLPIYEGLPDY